MQDKETVDDAEEALTSKAETVSDRKGSFDKKDASESLSKKESSKDGKFAFKKMKQPKKGEGNSVHFGFQQSSFSELCNQI